jgi:hypothetical protein
MPKLNKQFVDKLKRVHKDTLYRDSSVVGFALRVKPSGARTWVVQYRNQAGRTRKLAMKNSSAATPEEARRWAKLTLGQVAAGRDPSAERNAQLGAMTMAQLCDEYITAAKKGLVLGKAGRRKSPLTIATDIGRVRGHIKPVLGQVAVKAVTHRDVVKFLDAVQLGKTAVRRMKGKPRQGALPAGGPGAAARTVGLLRRDLQLCRSAGVPRRQSRARRPTTSRQRAHRLPDDGGLSQVGRCVESSRERR